MSYRNTFYTLSKHTGVNYAKKHLKFKLLKFSVQTCTFVEMTKIQPEIQQQRF